MADDKIVVEKTVLEGILKDIKELKKSDESKDAIIKQLREDNEKLISVADKKRVADYDANHAPNVLSREARVAMMGDLFIVGYKMVKNVVTANLHNNRVEAEQTIKLFLKKDNEQTTPEEMLMTYKEFSAQKTSLKGQIVSINSTTDKTDYVIEFEDGRKITIDVNYVNL